MDVHCPRKVQCVIASVIELAAAGTHTEVRSIHAPAPMTFRSTVDFLLRDWIGVESLTSRPRFAEHSRETFDSVLDACQRITLEKLAPSIEPTTLLPSPHRPVATAACKDSGAQA